MNTLERVAAAIQGKPVDRFPISLHNFEMCANASGMSYDTFFTSGEKMAYWQIQLWKRFNHDIILHENGTATLAKTVGCKIEYRSNKSPAVVASALERIEDINRLKPVRPELDEVVMEVLKGTGILVKELGNRAFIMGRADQGPFSLAALMLGMDNFLIELATGENRREVDLLLEYCTDVIIRYAKSQIRQGCPITSIGDSTAGPDVVSPAMYREYALPYEKIIADEVHNAGGMLSLHICGNATSILPDMIKSGANVLEIDQKTDLGYALKIAKGKTCVMGNISPEKIRNGLLEEINEAVQVALEASRGCQGLILGPGCALAGDTTYEKIDALINDQINRDIHKHQCQGGR